MRIEISFVALASIAALAVVCAHARTRGAAPASGASAGERGPTTRPYWFTDKGRNAEGFQVYEAESPWHAGKTRLRILLPDRMDKDKRYRVMYVLPVEASDGRLYGDGLAEVRKLDLHNRHKLICVQPGFSHVPWYADHPTDHQKWQESYFVKLVLPFIERTCPALAEPRGRLLLGFSKSGWGAWSLLLRHPKVFGKAVAWDAPLVKARPDQFGMGEIFGTQENFEKYRITALLARQAGRLGKTERLALLGYGNFRDHHLAVRKQLLALKLPHRYADGPQRKHHWSGGWVAEAVEFLAGK